MSEQLIHEFVIGKDPWQMDGHKFYLPRWGEAVPISLQEILLNFIQVGLGEHKMWEPETTELVKSIVKEGQVAIDIGASIGYFTMLFARQTGKAGRVISIEPTGHQFNMILRNITLNGYDSVVNPFMLSASDKFQSVPMPHHLGHISIGLPLDDLLESIGIMQVNFIKSDTDGFEPKVLRGLQRTIERSKDLHLVVEYMPNYLEKEGSSSDELKEILDRYFEYDVNKRMDHYNVHCVRKQ